MACACHGRSSTSCKFSTVPGHIKENSIEIECIQSGKWVKQSRRLRIKVEFGSVSHQGHRNGSRSWHGGCHQLSVTRRQRHPRPHFGVAHSRILARPFLQNFNLINNFVKSRDDWTANRVTWAPFHQSPEFVWNFFFFLNKFIVGMNPIKKCHNVVTDGKFSELNSNWVGMRS